MRVVITDTGIKFEEPTSCLYRAVKWRTPEGKLILIESSSVTYRARKALIALGFKPVPPKTRKRRLPRALRLI